MYDFNVPPYYVGYPQMSYQPQQPQNQQPRTNKIYVSGLEGARSYPLAPNSDVIACDDTNDMVYDIVVDVTGKRTIIPLDVVKHVEKPVVDYSQFATKEDIEKLRAELKAKE